MRKLLTVTVLLTMIFAGCAGQREKSAVPVEKPTVSVENDTVVPSEETNETDSTISEGNNDIVIPEEPTAVPELTATPEPTATISPTDEPVPTATPVPTVTPVPTATPAPTATPEPHIHSYTEKVTEPTCEEKGYTVFTCDCGDSYIANEVPATEHCFGDYKYNNDATYTADGTKTSVCDNCDAEDTVTAKGTKLEYTYTEMAATKYAKSSVSVRDLPSTDGKKVGKLSESEKVTVTGKCKETGWYRIAYNEGVAYVSNDYIVDTDPNPPKQVYTLETLPVKLHEPIYFEDGSAKIYCLKVTVELLDHPKLDWSRERREMINEIFNKCGTNGRVYFEPNVEWTDYLVEVDGYVTEVIIEKAVFVPYAPLGSDGPSFVGLKENPANRKAVARRDITYWDVNGKSIGVLKQDEEVKVIGTVFVAAEHNLYLVIEYKGQKVYVDKLDLEQYDDSGVPMYTAQWYKFWNGKTYAEYKQSDYRYLIYLYDEDYSKAIELPEDYVFGKKEVVYPNGDRYDWPY